MRKDIPIENEMVLNSGKTEKIVSYLLLTSSFI